MTTITEVVNKLESLGTSEHIALFLQDQGIKATRCDAFSCAVAAYASEQIGRAGDVAVNVGRVTVYGDTGYEDVLTIVGSPIQQFINDFDAGKYPELDINAD